MDATAHPPRLEELKRIYRAAIDARASDREGRAWWREVAVELEAVIAAPDARAAAALIAWWHADWRQVGDTPQQAARRIRRAARPANSAVG